MAVETKRVHIWVSGRVQGVFFRQSAVEEARRRGLGGWVRNLADGRVEGVAEGPSETVDAWVGWCRKGPPTAAVDTVEAVDEEPQGETEFAVSD